MKEARNILGWLGMAEEQSILEDAQKHGFITLRTDPTSGTYVVAGFVKGSR